MGDCNSPLINSQDRKQQISVVNQKIRFNVSNVKLDQSNCRLNKSENRLVRYFLPLNVQSLSSCTCNHPRQCKTSSISQSAVLSISKLSVRLRQKLKKPRTQICMDLSYTDSQARVQNSVLQVIIKAIINQYPSNCVKLS